MDQELIDRIKKLKFKVDERDGSLIAIKSDNGYKITPFGDRYRYEHLYSDYVIEDADEEELIKNLEKQSGYFTYGCGFGVTGFIIPKYWRDAKSYLEDDDMEQYYNDHQHEDITKIVWKLEDKQRGTIYIYTTARLGRDGLNSLKNWIDGQNSDGLGEGFEQQDFIRMQNPGETIVAGNIYKLDGFESTH